MDAPASPLLPLAPPSVPAFRVSKSVQTRLLETPSQNPSCKPPGILGDRRKGLGGRNGSVASSPLASRNVSMHVVRVAWLVQ